MKNKTNITRNIACDAECTGGAWLNATSDCFNGGASFKSYLSSRATLGVIEDEIPPKFPYTSSGISDDRPSARPTDGGLVVVCRRVTRSFGFGCKPTTVFALSLLLSLTALVASTTWVQRSAVPPAATVGGSDPGVVGRGTHPALEPPQGSTATGTAAGASRSGPGLGWG